VNSRLRPRLATLPRHVTNNPSPHVPVDSTLTNRDAHNSFRTLHLRAVSARRIRSHEKCRVSLASFNIPTFKPSNLPTFSDRSLFLSHGYALRCTFLHSSKAQLSSFQPIPHSASKNRATWSAPRPAARFKMNQPAADFHAAIDFSRRVCPRSTGDAPPRFGASRSLRLASPSCRFLVNYRHPMFQMAGLGSHIPTSTRGPRS
jgi:hypothetical protein